MKNLHRVIELIKYPHDISGDLMMLYFMARECDTILELGVRDGISTRALAWGLQDSCLGEGSKKMISVDILPYPSMLRKDLDGCGFWQFVRTNDRCFECDDSFDIVFIDTSHIYEHTKFELEKFGKLARRWIICHDYSEILFPGVVRAVDEFCHKYGLKKLVTSGSKYGSYWLRSVIIYTEGWKNE